MHVAGTQRAGAGFREGMPSMEMECGPRVSALTNESPLQASPAPAASGPAHILPSFLLKERVSSGASRRNRTTAMQKGKPTLAKGQSAPPEVSCCYRPPTGAGSPGLAGPTPPRPAPSAGGQSPTQGTAEEPPSRDLMPPALIGPTGPCARP